MAFLSNLSRSLRSTGSKLISFRTLSNVNTSSTTFNTISPILPIATTKTTWNFNNVQLPTVSYNNKVNLPNGMLWIPPILEPPCDVTTIEAPSTDTSEITKHAHRLLIIRRKKMKKHKLRKLRKRLKFERAKIRQRREMRKEKEFQAILIQQCKQGEAFSAEKYVEERITELNRQPAGLNYKSRPTPR